MAVAAEKALTLDPNSTDMMLILADYYSSSGAQLDKASTYAKKAIELLPAAKAPDGVSADQWQKQVTFQTGIAWSAQGQVLINKNDLAGAASAFQKASPMLKGDVNSYARNLYRLGFTDARLQKIPEARAALTEAISYNTPFKALAQQTLDKLGPAPPPKRTGRGNSQ
jgi:tetratricopeptide (TPR) repeat protein